MDWIMYLWPRLIIGFHRRMCLTCAWLWKSIYWTNCCRSYQPVSMNPGRDLHYTTVLQVSQHRIFSNVCPAFPHHNKGQTNVETTPLPRCESIRNHPTIRRVRRTKPVLCHDIYTGRMSIGWSASVNRALPATPVYTCFFLYPKSGDCGLTEWTHR